MTIFSAHSTTPLWKISAAAYSCGASLNDYTVILFSLKAKFLYKIPKFNQNQAPLLMGQINCSCDRDRSIQDQNVLIPERNILICNTPIAKSVATA